MPERYGLFFSKYVASGNDFIILDNISGEIDTMCLDLGDVARDICRRRLSVGADGLLVLESSARADIRMRIINPDGSEASMCGNGARCAALYVSDNGAGSDLKIETGAGIIGASVAGDNVKVRMSDPHGIELGLKLGVGDTIATVHKINTGVPHAVHMVEDIENFPVEEYGRKIREHSAFSPQGTNVNFVGDPKNNLAPLRTYERGVESETLSCGTGTVASAVVLGLLGQAESPAGIRTRSGEILTVYFRIFPGHIVRDVYLEGSARKAYEGKV